MRRQHDVGCYYNIAASGDPDDAYVGVLFEYNKALGTAKELYVSPPFADTKLAIRAVLRRAVQLDLDAAPVFNLNDA